MPLQPIIDGLPSELIIHLLENECVYYFSYISSDTEYNLGWLALTENRFLYNSKGISKSSGSVYDHEFIEVNESVQKDGILPFNKISYIEVKEDAKENIAYTPDPAGVGCAGCSSKPNIRRSSSTLTYTIELNTSGGTSVIIPIPTKEKGYEIRKVFSELTQK